MRRKRRWLLLAAALALLVGTASADVVLDGSFDPAAAGEVVTGGSWDGLFADFLVTDDLGRRYGQNLFHSFEEFDLDPGQVASFVDTGASGSSVLRNVLARVTGGPSSIDGLIRSQIAGASLFLLNPAGMIFGPTSSIDVPGAFHASNASSVGFASGPDFVTGAVGGVAVQTADPVSFGFMGRGDGALVEAPAIVLDGASIVPGGGRVSIVGSGVQLRNDALLQTEGGRIDVVSVDSAGRVTFEPGMQGAPQLEGFGKLGQIELLDSAIETEAGGVGLVGRSISLSGEAEISTSTSGSEDGGGVSVSATSLTLTGDAEIASDVEDDATGNGGSVLIDSYTISILDGAEISSDTEGAGDAGDVEISAERLEIRSNAADPGERAGIFSNSKEAASGDAGDIQLDVGTLDMRGGVIAASASGASRGGNVRIGARDLVWLDRGAEITATVEAPIDDPAAEPEVANIDIGRAPQSRPQAVVLNRGSRIEADATGLGGRAGDIFIGSETFFRSPDSEVSASSASGGELDGNIVIESPVVDLQSNLVTLETAFADGASMIRATCAAQGASGAGSFAVAARRGVPASPEGLLLAFDAMDAAGPDSLAGEPAETSADARVAWNRGAEAFRGGNFEAAERELGSASREFANVGDPTMQVDSLRGLAQAQQAQGEYAESLLTLREALELVEESDDPARLASVLGSLGNAQLALGNPPAASELLSRGLAVARDAGRPGLASGLSNNLGNQQAAAGAFDEAVSSYEEAASLAAEAGDATKQAKALSNAARAALDGGRLVRGSALLLRAGQQVGRLEDSHDKAYMLIHLAKSYEQLARQDGAREQESLLAAHTLLQEAAGLAKATADARALSYAYGNLGSLYEGQERRKEALYFTHQALRWAEKADAPEALYRWQWQAGRLYWAEGNGNEALRSYRRAVAILEETRQETLARYESSEVYFRRAVAPVYDDLTDALLQGAGMLSDPGDSQQLLAEAQATVELLKAAELRDYFRDECVVEFNAQARPLTEISTRAAVVYPILLDERLELLVGMPGGLERVRVEVPRSRVEAAARRLREHLQAPLDSAYRPDSEALYDWIIRPIAQKLEAAGIDTLVFVPGGALRSIPMGALHDGDRFLVERYALALAPGLSLPDPTPLDPTQTEFLLAGVSESVQNFEPLPAVPRELAAIHELYGGRVLLDEEFELERLEREIASGRPGVVHLATHAVFRGNAEESFLLTHDGRLDMKRLGEIVGSTRYREQPVELLTLSACETAAGDDRAALGLAGVAIRAGARSALGSLWTISDDATYDLVVQFYTNLKDPSLTKAQALQKAQQKLLASNVFAHPFYWSPFLLISNWL